MHETTSLQAAQLRVECLKIAQALCGNTIKPDALIDMASKFESYAWGGFAPVTKPATPLSTIKEAGEAMTIRLKELYDNTPEGFAEKFAMSRAAGLLNRIIADLEASLGEHYS